MFVVIYTYGPAWQTGKTVEEQPLLDEHIQYMQQVFAARQLLMGGPFLDTPGSSKCSLKTISTRKSRQREDSGWSISEHETAESGSEEQ